MTLPQTPSLTLHGKSALVTGGSKGIGFACAAALAQAGAAVTLLARPGIALDLAVEGLSHAGYSARPFAFDLSNIALFEKSLKDHPTFDILVNSAGVARHQNFLDVQATAYRESMQINLDALFWVSQAVSRRLVAENRPGSLIHVSSQMGHVGGPKRTVYCATKHAIEGLTKAMAIELGPLGIRVNSLCPTFVETEFTRSALTEDAFRTWVLSRIHLKRLGTVEDLMGPCVFLASDASRLMTGASLKVDGGWTAG